jgi:hypothetical protein
MNTRERMKKKAKKLGTESIILFDGTGIFSTNKTKISYSERTALDLWKKYPIINYPKR